jgi:hypothetical protein
MAHLVGLLIFVVLVAAQIAAVAVNRNERRYREEPRPRDPVHGLREST